MKRLAPRLAVRLIAVAVFVALAGAILTFFLVRSSLIDQAGRHAAGLAEALRHVSEILAPEDQIFGLRRTVERFGTLDEVRLVAVFDAAGRPIASSDQTLRPDQELVASALAADAMQSRHSEDAYFLAAPLHGRMFNKTQRDVAGAVYLELSLDRYMRELFLLNEVLLGVVALMAVVLVGLAITILRRLVVNRLAPVVRGLADVEAGLPAPLLPVPPGDAIDEIDRLARQFNHMAATIQARTRATDMAEAALQQAYKNMEKTVQERTSELEEANAHLQAEVEERRMAENALHEQKLFLSTVLEGIKAAIFLFDPQAGEMVSANSVALTLIGMEENELSCRTDTLAFVAEGESRSVLCPEWSEKGTYMEGVLLLRDGKRVPAARHLLDIFVDGREHLVQLFFDITERRNLERRLSIAQKLESIGLLASGIAHEINTPIQYVGDSVQFLEDSFTDILKIAEACALPQKNAPPPTPQELADIVEAADLEFLREEIPKACARAQEGVQRVSKIVLAMKNFAHPGGEEKKPVDINMAVQNTLTVARNEWKYAAEIVTDLSDELPLIPCRLGDINQVILNMLVNAAHAIAEKNKDTGELGQITVTTRVRGEFVELGIADTGTGIAKENVDRVFDPFFTTKEVGRGTGQGLALAHDIVVEKHGGSIEVQTELGKGTTFFVLLPINPSDMQTDHEENTVH